MAKPKLRPRHKRVVDAYFANGGNKAAALRECGYKVTTITTNPQSVFDHPAVVAYMKEKGDRMAEKHEVDADFVIDRLRRIADFSLGQLLDVKEDGSAEVRLDKLTEEQKSVLAAFESETRWVGRGEEKEKVTFVKIKPPDVLGALNSLARILGMNDDKLSVSGEMSLVDRIQQGRKRAGKD